MLREANADATDPAIRSAFARLRAHRRMDRQAAQEAAARAAALEQEIAALRATPPAPETPEPVRPNRAQFDSPEAYDAAIDTWAAAHATWTAEKATRDAAAQAATERQQQQMAAFVRHVETIETAFQPQRTAAIAAHPDYETVVEGPPPAGQPTFSPELALTLKQQPNGAELAYQIAKKPGEIARLLGMPSSLMGAEIGRMSAALATPPRPDVSNAPPPITPIRGGSAPVIRRNAEPSMAEVAAKVTREYQERRIATLPRG